MTARQRDGAPSPSPGPAAPSPGTTGFWVAAAAFVALIVATQLVESRPAPLMRGLSLVLLALALVFVGLPFLQLRKHSWSVGGSFTEATALARRGPYALVRHPQYLGADFLAWGLATTAPHWGTVLAAILITVGFSRQARAEERFLLQRFPDAYRDYMRLVPRFGLLTGIIRWALRTGRGGGT